MKCTRCHGTGKITEWVATDTVSKYEFPCRKCNGTGEIEVTNEEWLKQCTTEQLAEWMVMLQLVGVYPIKRGSIDTEMFIADTVEWLKQPYSPK